MFVMCVIVCAVDVTSAKDDVEDLLARVAELEGQVAAESGVRIDGNYQIIFTRGTTNGNMPFGIFKVSNRAKARDTDKQELLTKIEPGKMWKSMAHFGDMFVIRSGDMEFRAKVTVEMNTHEINGKTRPYKLHFKNLAYEDDAPAIELKHGNSGFTWIPPAGGDVVHETDQVHEFTLRNGQKQPVITVALRHRTNTM